MDLKKLRTDNHLTMKQMAELIGKSPASVTNYEKGKTPIPEDVLKILEEKFGSSVEEKRNQATPTPKKRRKEPIEEVPAPVEQAPAIPAEEKPAPKKRK